MTALAVEPSPRPAGLRCLFCRQRVYLVQHANGDQFLVSHYGKVSCPLRAHRTKQTPKQRRKKRR